MVILLLFLLFADFQSYSSFAINEVQSSQDIFQNYTFCVPRKNKNAMHKHIDQTTHANQLCFEQ